MRGCADGSLGAAALARRPASRASAGSAERWVVVDTETSGLDPAARPTARDRRGRRRRRRHRCSATASRSCLRSDAGRRCREHRRAWNRTRRAGGGHAGARSARGVPRLGGASAPRGLSRRFRSGGAAQRRSPASGMPPPTTRRGSTSRRSPRALVARRVSPRRPQPRRLARGIRHRMRDPPQRRGRRARDRRAAVAAARDRREAGPDRLRRAGADRAPAEMAGITD